MNIKSNKLLKVSRNVYGLIAMMVIIFAVILLAIEIQSREGNRVNTVANDYHRSISEKSLKLLNSVSRLRLWLQEQEIVRLNKKLTDKKKLSFDVSTYSSRFDQKEAFIYESNKLAGEINTIQMQYANPEFEGINVSLQKVQSSVSTNLKDLKLDGLFSLQGTDNIIMPLISVTHQLHRLHHLTYKKIQKDRLDSKASKKTQLISLIALLIVCGVFGITRMLWHVRDTLIELKDTQIKLQEENAFVTSLLDTAPVIVLLLNDKGLIQYVNPYFERLTGFYLADVKGKEWFSTFLPDDYQENIHELFQSTLQHIPAQGNINPIVDHEGVEHEIEWYSQTLQLQDENNNLSTSVLCTGQDITDRIITELELEKHREQLEALVVERTKKMRIAVEEAENANKAKSEFLSSMSHELRTPMNAVLGFSQLLEDDTESPLTADQLESVEHIMEGGKHLLNLIDDVLDLSKIETGHDDVSIEIIDTATLVTQVLLLIQPQAEQNGITLENKVSNDSSFKIRADQKKLKQVLLNLCSNAIKYNSENGVLTMSCNEIKENKVRFSVSDTGKGVAEELFPNLFEPFDRLDKASSNIQGTGIGLTICKKLVEQMSGAIGVFKNPDKGLTFWVEFDIDSGNEGMSG